MTTGLAFTGFPPAAFEFYEGLAADNSKAYWSAHQERYTNAVRAPLLALAAELEQEFGEPRLYRPNRDTRFAADKSPYRSHQGLYIEVADSVYYYVNLDAEGLITGGGLHTQDRYRVAAYRAMADDDRAGTALERIVESLAGQGFQISGEKVRTRPRGVPADHPRLELMRHQSLNARRRLPRGAHLHGRGVLDLIRRDWLSLRPLNEWMTANLSGATH